MGQKNLFDDGGLCSYYNPYCEIAFLGELARFYTFFVLVLFRFDFLHNLEMQLKKSFLDYTN